MELQQLQEIPRTVVRTWLRAAQVPLRVVERVAHRDDAAEWPPALVFESFEAQVKQVVGGVLRDDELVAEGRLIEAKVGQLRKAAQLETVAERRKATAVAREQATRESAQQRRRRVAREAAQRDEALERERTAKKQRAEQAAERERRDAARSETAARKALARKERAAAQTRVAGERRAVSKQRAASTAKKRAVSADKQIRATQAVRRAGR
jgi:hypothetical protein